jgi:Zn-dependent peptidase ImmA (M78 family)/transcriptional regulator with XRE-family HTH domain
MTMHVNVEMIRQARLSRGMSQVQVATHLGIKQPAYSKIENGNIAVSLEHLKALAHLFGYPESFFFQTERIWGLASPHHRKRKSLTITQLETIEAQLNIVRLNIRHLASNVDLQPLSELPNLDVDEVGGATEVARQVRRLLRVPSGPIGNVTQLLEDAGVFIMEWQFPSDRIDAISIWGFGEHPVILLNEAFPADRKRLTLAHEGGHLVMHATNVSPDPEAEANSFARELLMPEEEIRPDLAGLRISDLPDLKRRWKVSMRGLVYCAQDIKAITRDQARYMFMRLSQQYGAKHEPIALPPEPPSLIKEVLDHYFKDMGYTVEQVAGLTHRTVDEFEQLFGLQRRPLRALR